MMSDVSTIPRVHLDAFEQLAPSVRSFLVESQRRVIDHCARLLAAEDLTEDHRNRLTRLAGVAKAELQRLVEQVSAVPSVTSDPFWPGPSPGRKSAAHLGNRRLALGRFFHRSS
jgi:hypothetical protein